MCRKTISSNGKLTENCWFNTKQSQKEYISRCEYRNGKRENKKYPHRVFSPRKPEVCLYIYGALPYSITLYLWVLPVWYEYFTCTTPCFTRGVLSVNYQVNIYLMLQLMFQLALLQISKRLTSFSSRPFYQALVIRKINKLQKYYTFRLKQYLVMN